MRFMAGGEHSGIVRRDMERDSVMFFDLENMGDGPIMEIPYESGGRAVWGAIQRQRDEAEEQGRRLGYERGRADTLRTLPCAFAIAFLIYTIGQLK